MTRLARRLIWIGFPAAFVVSLTAFVIYRIDAGIAASVDNKSSKTTTATVVSVTEVRRTDLAEVGSNNQLYKVCFTIDNFDQVAADTRYEYQSAEVQRLSRDGPRCKVTTKAAIAKRLNKGDKLTVVYLLENQGHIDMVGNAAFGEDL